MKRIISVLVLSIACVGIACGAGKTEKVIQRPIGIISAMTVEMEYLKNQMGKYSEETIGGVIFYSGTLQGKQIVLASGGVGKVANASATTSLILKYNPTVIIFTGIAGGVKEGIKTLDVVIATGLIQHDYGNHIPSTQETDRPRLGTFEWLGGNGAQRKVHPDGMIFPINEEYSTVAYNAAVNVVGVDHSYRGIIATGDQFIESSEYVAFLRTLNADAVEMEGAAVAVVAEQFSIPLVVIRALSDNADEAAALSYEELEQKSSEISEQIVMQLLKEIK